MAQGLLITDYLSSGPTGPLTGPSLGAPGQWAFRQRGDSGSLAYWNLTLATWTAISATGPTGPAGAAITGPAGPTGATGAAGATVTGPTGPTGPGPGAGGTGFAWMATFVAPPALASWTWLNQGSATAIDTPFGLLITVPNHNSDSVNMLYFTAPTGPYTMTAAMVGGGDGANMYGLALQASGAGGYSQWCWGNSADGDTISANKWTNSTTFSANYIQGTFSLNVRLRWMRIQDDGANRIYWMSLDGIHWVQLFSVGRTDFLTPDRVGIFVNARSIKFGEQVLLLSWQLG